MILILACCSGASCRQLARNTDPLAPVAFAGPPTVDDVIYAVNTNSARINQLATQSAALSTAGVPTLRASLAMERPLRLRLRGKLLISDEIDLGSNDELLWFWAKSDPQRALYYSYHEQFAQSVNNAILPIGPDWLIEALGLVTLDPAAQHEGPTLRPDNGIEIRSRIDRRGAVLTRVLVIDGKYGWIKEQQILDLSGRTLAIARASNHRFYPEAGVSLPHRIQIELPSTQLAFQLDVDSYAINQLLGNPDELFKPPQYEGYRVVNLADLPNPAMQPNQSRSSIYAPQPQQPEDPRTSYQQRYRGFSTR